MMNTCRKSPIILLRLICITFLPAALEAQEIKVRPEVTGYLGHDVTLPCQFIPGPEDTIIQLQWELMPPEGEKIVVVVSSPQLGVNVSDSFLKDRVEIAEQSLLIRDVELRDAGLYICSITAFPSGSFEATTNLVVGQEQMQLSSGVVSAIVIAVMLLLVIMAAIIYFIFIRRGKPKVRHRVYIDTAGPVMDVFRPSVIRPSARDEDVVYSDVKLKPSRDASPPCNEKHRADDVTYSEVLVLHQYPK